jgi:hypothetical protein
VIWVHELLRSEERADGELMLTFSILDPVSMEPTQVDIVFAKDEAEALRQIVRKA